MLPIPPIAASSSFFLRFVIEISRWWPFFIPVVMIGLALTRIHRSQAAGVYCWMPCVMLTLIASSMPALRLWRIEQASQGPDAGWAAMETPMVLPGLAGCIILALGCWFYRPDREVITWSRTFMAFVLWAAVLLLLGSVSVH